MSVDNRIHYLQGVIDTLSQIIAQNTNIKLNLDFQQIIKDEYVEKPDTLNHIESIDTAKNYIQLFYSKWTKPHQRKQTEPLIKKYFDLLESC